MRILFFSAFVALLAVVAGNTHALLSPSWFSRSFIVERAAALPTKLLGFALPSISQQHEVLLVLGKSGAGWTAGELTDTILVVNLNAQTQQATILSLPRDLLVAVSPTRTNKINAIWLIGKQDALARNVRDVGQQGALIKAKVEDVTGLQIDNIVVVDIAAVSQAVDALGGVAVNVTERLDDPAFPTQGGGIEHFVLEKGFQVLDGATAAKFARTRHTPEGDFDRLRRQHQLLEAMVAKAEGLKLTENIPKLLSLYQGIAPHVETTIGIHDIPVLVSAFRDIPLSNVKTFALERIGGESLLISAPGSSFIPKGGLSSYDEIRTAILGILIQE